jgi:hypothetical protein
MAMTMRRTLGLLSGLALTTFSATPAAAQVIAYRDARSPARATALAAAYHVRLRSAWPQVAAGVEACQNGGTEIVEGRLARQADGVYRGWLDRRTLILFCGAHGAHGEACELVLEGEGTVAMTGVVVRDEASPSGSALRASWHPSPTHSAAVRGACSADFKRSIQEMYLSVTHGAEFAVPAVGAGKRQERLENYAWTVEIE